MIELRKRVAAVLDWGKVLEKSTGQMKELRAQANESSPSGR